MRPKISSIIAEAASRAKKEKRIEVLRKYDHPALRIVLALALNPNVKWDLPEGDPVFVPNELAHDQEGALYNEVRKLYLFLQPNHLFREYNPNLTTQKRGNLFIQFLETIDAEDARLMVAASHKKLPVKLSAETIEEAFPGVISWGGQ